MGASSWFLTSPFFIFLSQRRGSQPCTWSLVGSGGEAMVGSSLWLSSWILPQVGGGVGGGSGGQPNHPWRARYNFPVMPSSFLCCRLWPQLAESKPGWLPATVVWFLPQPLETHTLFCCHLLPSSSTPSPVLPPSLPPSLATTPTKNMPLGSRSAGKAGLGGGSWRWFPGGRTPTHCQRTHPIETRRKWSCLGNSDRFRDGAWTPPHLTYDPHLQSRRDIRLLFSGSKRYTVVMVTCLAPFPDPEGRGSGRTSG